MGQFSWKASAVRHPKLAELRRSKPSLIERERGTTRCYSITPMGLVVGLQNRMSKDPLTTCCLLELVTAFWTHKDEAICNILPRYLPNYLPSCIALFLLLPRPPTLNTQGDTVAGVFWSQEQGVRLKVGLK